MYIYRKICIYICSIIMILIYKYKNTISNNPHQLFRYIDHSSIYYSTLLYSHINTLYVICSSHPKSSFLINSRLYSYFTYSVCNPKFGFSTVNKLINQ